MSVRIVFLYGRPGPHPFHRALAQALAPDFLPVDFLLRWYDVPASRLRRYLSWLLCALFFAGRDAYHVFFTDGIHFPPLIMRKLCLLRRRQKVVALLDDHTLYFLRAGRYPRLSARALRWALNTYDALICVGEMQTELARAEVTGERPLVLTTRSGISRHRLPLLVQNRPNLEGRTILFIGNGPSGWRAWYKGADLLLEAFDLATATLTGLRLRIVGEWDHQYVEELLARFPRAAAWVEFAGVAHDLAPYLAQAALYVHLGRGEAFGISVLEAMCAGVPAIVSEWTGAREAVAEVDSGMIVSLEAKQAAERIRWYFGLPLDERRAFSDRSREVAARYTEEHAQAAFVGQVRRILRRFDLPDLNPR